MATTLTKLWTVVNARKKLVGGRQTIREKSVIQRRSLVTETVLKELERIWRIKSKRRNKVIDNQSTIDTENSDINN